MVALRRPLIAALLAGLVLGGCASTQGRTPSPDPAPAARRPYDPAAEPWLAAAGRTVQGALANFAATHDGKYPPNGQFPLELVTYLPEADLPASPAWPEGTRQAKAVAVPAALAGAAAGQPSPLGTVIGRGRLPTSDQDFTAATWGAWLYDHDAASNRYVIYGVGRSGDYAVVGYVGSAPF